MRKNSINLQPHIYVIGLIILVLFFSCKDKQITKITNPSIKQLSIIDFNQGINFGTTGEWHFINDHIVLFFREAMGIKVFNIEGNLKSILRFHDCDNIILGPYAIVPFKNSFAVFDYNHCSLYFYETLTSKCPYKEVKIEYCQDFLIYKVENNVHVANLWLPKKNQFILPVELNSSTMKNDILFTKTPLVSIIDTTGSSIKIFGKYPSSYTTEKTLLHPIRYKYYAANLDKQSIVVSLEHLPTLLEYTYDGDLLNIKENQSSEIINPNGFNEIPKNNDLAFGILRDTSYIYYKIHYDDKRKKYYRWVLLPSQPKTKKMIKYVGLPVYERPKILQIYNDDLNLESEISFQNNIIDIVSMEKDSLILVDLNEKKDHFIMYSYHW